MLDLADIFAPAPDVPSAANSWDSSGGHIGLAQAGPLRSDPLDSLGKLIWLYISNLYLYIYIGN